MPREIDLGKLSHAEKDAIILSLLPLVGQLEAALARIAELEARLALLEKPAKTPDNSSLPPSKGQKSDQPADGAKPPRKSRPGFGRALEPNPDRIVDRLLDACPRCAAAWPAAPQTPQLVYDRIELPPIKPDVTRVRLFGGRCACCGERAVAAAPAGLEPGSPFGRSIEALVVYLHYAQAIGIERLRCVLAELFGLSISEGALCNVLQRPRPRAGSPGSRRVGDRGAGHGCRCGGVGRDLGAGDEADTLGVGVRYRRLRAAHHPPQPGSRRGAGAVRRGAAARLGVRQPG